MSYYYWLNLFGSVLVGVLAGCIISVMDSRFSFYGTSCSSNFEHPLCATTKKNIRDAKIAELAAIDGISLPVAKSVRRFLLENPHKNLEHLDTIRGIGKKTIEKLKQYFSFDSS